MTEDAQSRMRGYGPFHEGAEPTAQINAQTAASTPVTGAPHPGAQSISDGPDAVADPINGGPHPGAQPTISGGPYPGPQPIIGAPHAGADPINGGPYAGSDPVSGGPHLGAQPVSGGPHPGAQPISGGPHPGPHLGPNPNAQPISGAGYPAGPDPYPLDSTGLPVTGSPYDFTPAAPTSGGAPDFTYTGRRIEPSPPPERNRLIIGLAAGLVAGLLLFGTAGYFVGRSTHPATAAPASPAPTPTPSGTLGIFEQNQVALNQPHFTAAALNPLAQGWLPYLSNCARNGEGGGPVLNAGEKVRVRCTLNGMSVIFVEYASIADRDKARVKTLGQNVDARALTPGVGAATQRPAPSERTTGNYVEYAYRLTEGRVARTVAGIWWDDAQTPVAAYLLAYWKAGVGESWEPMRDLWSRYA